MDNYNNNGYNNDPYQQGAGQNPQPNNYGAQDYQQPYGAQDYQQPYGAQDYQQPYGVNDNQNYSQYPDYSQNNYQQYQAPQYNNQYPVEDSTAKNYATASLVLGIVSFFCCGLPCSVLSLIFGIISKKRMPENNGKATAGIVLAIVAMVLWLVSMILIYVTPINLIMCI